MKRERAEREAAEQNRNEHTTDYFAFHAGRNRWQVRRRDGVRCGSPVHTFVAE